MKILLLFAAVTPTSYLDVRPPLGQLGLPCCRLVVRKVGHVAAKQHVGNMATTRKVGHVDAN